MSGLNGRIERLEKLLVLAPAAEPDRTVDAEGWERFAERLAALTATMRAEDKEELTALVAVLLTGGEVQEYRLSQIGWLALGWALELSPDAARPLSLCPEIYAALKAGAGLYHGCADCGCPIPLFAGCEVGSTTVPARRVLDRCPLCGGRTGHAAYRPALSTNT